MRCTRPPPLTSAFQLDGSLPLHAIDRGAHQDSRQGLRNHGPAGGRMNRPELSDLRQRIELDRVSCGGRLPEDHVIAWRAYLAGLLEWEVIPIQDFDALTASLPPVDDDPASAILLGRKEKP